MITKSRIVGLLLALGVVLLVYRSEDEPTDSNDRGSGTEPTKERQFQPREPAFLTPGENYGIAGRPGSEAALPSYADSDPYFRKPFPQGQSGEYSTTRPYDGQAPIQANGYRFRPLGEQERRRMQESYPDQYRERNYSAYSAREQPFAPTPYGTSPEYPNARQQVYSFRPLENSSGSRNRWQGPYQQPGWNDGRPPLDPWTAPPNPQWGSTPPVHRMYPSYSPDTSRRFAER